MKSVSAFRKLLFVHLKYHLSILHQIDRRTMRSIWIILFSLALGATASSTSPSESAALQNLAAAAPTGYAPSHTPCPSVPLTRSASGISQQEKGYVARRRIVAARALSSWLHGISPEFDSNCAMPVLGFSSSGGGQRAMLTTAGIHDAFDQRSGNTSTAGLLQALTYESALSGGALFLAGTAINNFDSVPTLLDSFWHKSLNNGFLTQSPNITRAINGEIAQKYLAGHPVDYVDYFGRFTSYALVSPEGGASSHFSDIVRQPRFRKFHAPFPVILTTGVNNYGDSCPMPDLSNIQYEFSPYEFGSWDNGVSAFVDIDYLGSQPHHNETLCVTGFDNTGYAIASSGDALGTPTDCLPLIGKIPELAEYLNVSKDLAGVIPDSNYSLFGEFPNPFYRSTRSPAVSEYANIELSDGGMVNDPVAIWPLLYRNVDVLFVADVGHNVNFYPNGTSMYNTYLRAQTYGLTRMPRMPDPATFVKRKFNVQNVFFGCNDTEAMTIVYLPNRDVVFPSNFTGTSGPVNDTTLYGLLDNGAAIGTNNGTQDWAPCVGCAIMMKSRTKLPDFCNVCFSKYCATW